MAQFKQQGIGDLILTMQEITEIPEDVQGEMLNAAADIAVEKTRAKGEAYQVKRTGETLRHIKKSKAKRGKNKNMASLVTFSGKNERGTRYAEIAFINNYGKKGQKARPFFSDGLKDSEQAAGKAEEEIYNKWIDSKIR